MIQIPSTDEEWTSLLSSILSQLPSSLFDAQPTPSTQPISTTLTPHSLAQHIDHTLLNLTASPSDLTTLCTQALTHAFRTVCVYPEHIPLCLTTFSKSKSKSESDSQPSPPPGIAAVISFPSGTSPTASKATSSASALASGATELDMVLNYPLLLEAHYTAVYHDILAVRQAMDSPTTGSSPLLKVILETSQLTPQQTVFASAIAILAGADFVKTSTGFRGRGASVQDVRIMRAVCDLLAGKEVGRGGGGGEEEGGVLRRAKVKASGGIRTAEDAMRMIEAGAERIGASKGVEIVEGYETMRTTGVAHGSAVVEAEKAKEDGY